MKTITQTSLYYAEGRSDKEYHVDLVEVAGGYVVNFRFARRGSALIERMRMANDILSACRHIKAVPVAETTDEKRRLWKRVHEAHGEGVVFKRMNAQVTEGRPNTGGDWLKFKFTASANCCVVGINTDKRSVRLGMIESRGHSITEQGMVPVGNVTIPPNQTAPNVGEIVEVEYLYAYPGGSLYQPVYRGKRRDLDISACTTRQLKYKPEGHDDDEA